MTSKERAFLRAQANELDTILQVGKNGVVDTLIDQVNDALEARELIKLRALETCPVTARDAAAELASETGAEVVQVIGSRLVLYRKSKNNSKIKLV